MLENMVRNGDKLTGDFGWRWHLKVLAIIYAVLFVVYLVIRHYIN